MIEEILKSKPHNIHYLNRYLKFIEHCKINFNPDRYVEQHHICPKSVDMFPEYSSFKKNPWNMIKLTRKQHYIAHLLLWKIYGGKNCHAVVFLFDKNISETVLENHRKELSKSMKQYNKKGKFKWITHNETKLSIRVLVTELEKYLNEDYYLGVKNSTNFHISKPDNKCRIHLHDKVNNKIVAIKIEEYEKLSKDDKKNFIIGTKSFRTSLGTTNNKVIVNDGKNEKFIDPKELENYLENGWNIGRKIEPITTLGKIVVNDGKNEKFIDPKELENYLENGWNKGKLEYERSIKMTKDSISKYIKIGDIPNYLENGWNITNRRSKYYSYHDV